MLFYEVRILINDITDKDIKELNDEELRELVGKLCEATLKRHNIDTICVTYGGDQNESDGGVDVRVKSTSKFNDDWAIPRNNTILQVKKPKMPESAIRKEMLNEEGKVKESINELVKLNGAYIIVSSGDSLTDKGMQTRIKAMENVLSSIDKNQSIKVDFYDSKRIAIWVKQFPPLVMWINEKVNKRTTGWRNYCNWSNLDEDEREYIIADGMFIHKENFQKENQRSVIEGINEIRKLLSKEKNIVRLAGLSGVGKTRFAQALFDRSIGENALDKNEVIYCDVSDEPTPVPLAFIQELISMGERTILIIDNCDKELHNRLAKFVCEKNSKISMMTIEYDVKEDINIESCNYYLDTSSDNTIRRLLKRDFNYIKDANIETIVKCADGNFRIARYLAKTIERNTSIGILKSEEMFRRLFFQNNKESEDLLNTGKICSIFISFNITLDMNEQDNEINIMSRLIGQKPTILIRNVNEITRRQIIQKRGNMRAVLPHAIANRMADELLSEMPLEIIIEEIKKSKRLEISFFRRLKFLHDKEYAIQMAEYYLDNMDFINIDKNEIEILQCIKTIVPEKILCKLEEIDDGKFFTRENENYYDWARILAYIAYEPALFYRSTMLLVEFAKSEKETENYNSIRNILYKLFHIALSGTHAKVKERLKVVNALIRSSDNIENNLAIKLLDNLLITGGFTGMIVEEYTSRKRDYGYYLETREEFNKWYITIFSFCEQLIKENISKEEIKEILAKYFRSLSSCGLYYELEKIVKEVLKKETWPQVWVSIGVIKHFDIDKVPSDMLKKMNILQKRCEPKTIEDKIQAFLNKGARIFWDLEDTTENEAKVRQAIKKLGEDIGKNKKELRKNILKIDNSCNLYRINDLVEGLYKEINDNEEFIYFILDNITNKNNNAFLQIVSTYIAFMNKDNKSNYILDEILEDKRYKKFYPEIQFGYQLEQIDITRVKKSLLIGVSPIEKYARIEFVLSKASINDIIEILKLFPKSNNSDNIIISVLNNLYFNKRENKELDKYSREFIANLDFRDRNNVNNLLNYETGKIVEKVFSLKNGRKQAKQIFNKFHKLINENGISYYGYEYVLSPLVKLYPNEFLNEIFNNNIPEYKIKDFVEGFGYHKNILELIDEEILIKWIEKNNKAKEIAGVINPIYKQDDEYKWRNISIYLLENYINDKEIVRNLIQGIYPMSWSEKYSTILEKRMNLAKELKDLKNEKIRNLGKDLERSLRKEINQAKISEEKEQERFNTFE